MSQLLRNVARTTVGKFRFVMLVTSCKNGVLSCLPRIKCFKCWFERSITINASSTMLEEYKSKATSLVKEDKTLNLQEFACMLRNLKSAKRRQISNQNIPRFIRYYRQVRGNSRFLPMHHLWRNRSVPTINALNFCSIRAENCKIVRYSTKFARSYLLTK